MTVTVSQPDAEARLRSAGAPPLLRLDAVAKRWPKAPSAVLDGVSLDVAPGTTVAVGGRNGAGKTTLLRIAAGLITPDRGRVVVDGVDLERDRTRAHRRIGFLAAGNTALYGRLTVEQHLDFWAKLALLPKAERAPAAEAAIETWALAELCGRRVDRLSMGQRQRLRIALALLHAPPLLLLDEPRTSLDAEGTELLAAGIERAVAAGGAAIVCLPTGEPEFLRFDVRLQVGDGQVTPA